MAEQWLNSGLTGTLSKAIADLLFLEFLDLSDNDIMVSVFLNAFECFNRVSCHSLLESIAVISVCISHIIYLLIARVECKRQLGITTMGKVKES